MILVRHQNQVTCQNKDRTEERFISFTSVCRDLDFMEEMKYPQKKIDSMTKIMLGTSSKSRSKRDNNKKNPKKGSELTELINAGLSLIPTDIIEGVTNLVEDGINAGISGKGKAN